MKFKKHILLFFSFILVIALGIFAFFMLNGPEFISGPKLKSIILGEERITITPGEIFEFKVRLIPSEINIGDIQLEWESSDVNVVTVSDGKLIGEKDGMAIVTAKGPNEISASCIVTVKTPSAYDTLSNEEKKLYTKLIDYSANLKNPSSISLRDVGLLDDYYAQYKYTYYKYDIQISGMNSFGGYSSMFLRWDGNTLLKPYLDGTKPDSHRTGESASQFDVNKINKAIEEYFSNS